VLDGNVTAWDRDGHAWLKTEYKGGVLACDEEHNASVPPSLADAQPPAMK